MFYFAGLTYIADLPGRYDGFYIVLRIKDNRMIIITATNVADKYFDKK